tara:strand:+ start:18875 stop:21001 length:2127 start_codon:yes stop_codon:yes gene_type:complete
MRQIAILFFTFLLIGCSTKIENLDKFKLLPSVQELEFKDTFSNLNFDNIKFAYSHNNTELPIRYDFTYHIKNNIQSESKIDYHIDSNLDLNQEGYKLDILKNKISIVAKDKAGLFYAFTTLDQLIEDSKDQNINLPILSIKDYPLIKFRPIHIDVKHHLEKESYYYQLMDHLAQLKINGIILEIEDKLKYRRRPEVGSEDALSIEKWKSISEYAKERNINISPLVQGLGHASYILKHDKNKILRDDPKSDWAFNPLDPETYRLQFDLYLDAMEATPYGKYLHVGGDEVQTTGRKSGKNSLELNLIWLNKVSAFAEKHDRIPVFWDDMLLKQGQVYYPIYDLDMSVEKVDSIWEVNEPRLNKFIKQFPKNCIYMRWNYHTTESYGNTRAMDWFTNNGLKVMGATAGQTRWTLMPQRESNIDQIRIFADQSIKRDFNGLLLTLWDDDSPHFELYKRGISAFAEYTWGGIKRTKSEFKSVFRHRTFGSEFESEEYAFIDSFDSPVKEWTNILLKKDFEKMMVTDTDSLEVSSNEVIHRNSLIHRKNPLTNYVIDLPDFDNKGSWNKKYSSRLEKISEQIKSLDKINSILNKIKEKDPGNKYLIEIYEQVSALAGYSFYAMEVLSRFDNAKNEKEENLYLKEIYNLSKKFKNIREKFEFVYSKTRILNKPESYILDQDHHYHPANQTKNFDWQFMAELIFLEKIKKFYKKDL